MMDYLIEPSTARTPKLDSARFGEPHIAEEGGRVADGCSFTRYFKTSVKLPVKSQFFPELGFPANAILIFFLQMYVSKLLTKLISNFDLSGRLLALTLASL